MRPGGPFGALNTMPWGRQCTAPLRRPLSGSPHPRWCGGVRRGRHFPPAGDKDVRWFSFDPEVHVERQQLSCYLTHTTPDTHKLIRENLHETPIYG